MLPAEMAATAAAAFSGISSGLFVLLLPLSHLQDAGCSRNDDAIFITELFVRKNVVAAVAVAGRHFQFSKTMLIYYEFGNSCAKINK